MIHSRKTEPTVVSLVAGMRKLFRNGTLPMGIPPHGRIPQTMAKGQAAIWCSRTGLRSLRQAIAVEHSYQLRRHTLDRDPLMEWVRHTLREDTVPTYGNRFLVLACYTDISLARRTLAELCKPLGLTYSLLEGHPYHTTVATLANYLRDERQRKEDALQAELDALRSQLR